MGRMWSAGRGLLISVLELLSKKYDYSQQLYQRLHSAYEKQFLQLLLYYRV